MIDHAIWARGLSGQTSSSKFLLVVVYFGPTDEQGRAKSLPREVPAERRWVVIYRSSRGLPHDIGMDPIFDKVAENDIEARMLL